MGFSSQVCMNFLSHVLDMEGSGYGYAPDLDPVCFVVNF